MSEISVEGLIQLVASGGLGALAWYLIVYAIPRMQDKYDVQLQNQQTVFIQQLQQQQKAFSEYNDKKDQLFRDAMNQMTTELISALKGKVDVHKS